MSPIPQFPNMTPIIAWGLDNVAGGVIVGIILLILSAFSIKKTVSDTRDKNVIYDWLLGKTKHLIPNTVGSPFDTITWPSTVDISSAVDMTEERVRYICTIDKRIQRQEQSDTWPNQKLEERWATREFVRDD